MTYGLIETAVPATEKQIGFLKSLIAERNQDNVKGDTVETIMNVLGEIFVVKHEASSAISDLLDQPKVIKVSAPVAVPQGGLLDGLPLSNYAVEIADEGLVFLRIAEFKGTIYLRQLVGAPGDFQKIKPVGARRALLANAIKAVGPKIAAARFGEEFTICGVCSSPLTDELSRERKIGPVCWKKF